MIGFFFVLADSCRTTIVQNIIIGSSEFLSLPKYTSNELLLGTVFLYLAALYIVQNLLHGSEKSSVWWC